MNLAERSAFVNFYRNVRKDFNMEPMFPHTAVGIMDALEKNEAIAQHGIRERVAAYLLVSQKFVCTRQLSFDTVVELTLSDSKHTAQTELDVFAFCISNNFFDGFSSYDMFRKRFKTTMHPDRALELFDLSMYQKESIDVVLDAIHSLMINDGKCMDERAARYSIWLKTASSAHFVA